MAASASDMYPKRKLEDMTNRLKKPRPEGKHYFPTLQERLPSPSSPCSSLSPQKDMIHRKSVQFELSRNQHYECPLLTPKDEDYYLESDVEETKSASIGSTDLDDNIDYISLSSTVSLLNTTRGNIQKDIRDLSVLRKKAQKASKLDLVDFYALLICNKTSLPSQHKVAKAPLIDWNKYHKGLGSVSLSNDCTNDNEKIVFEALNLFDITP